MSSRVTVGANDMNVDDTTGEDDDPEAESDETEAKEEPKFKKHFEKKQYNVIENYFEEGKSHSWYLTWHRVSIFIEEPHFHKYWNFAVRDFSFSLDTPDHEKKSDGPEPDDSEDQDETKASDDRIVQALVEQIEFKEEKPVRRLMTGRGRILHKTKIGIFNLEEGEKTGGLGLYEEVEINIYETGAHMGRILYWTDDSLEYEGGDDPYLIIQCHVPVGTLDAIRDEYVSAEGQHIVVHTELLLWEWDIQAALADPYQARTYHLEENHDSLAIVSSIDVTTEDDQPFDDESPEEPSETREVIQHLHGIAHIVGGLKWAFWTVGLLIFLAILFTR